MEIWARGRKGVQRLEKVLGLVHFLFQKHEHIHLDGNVFTKKRLDDKAFL